MHNRWVVKIATCITFILLFAPLYCSAQVENALGKRWSLNVTAAPGVLNESYTGRVYIFFTKKRDIEPRKVFRFVHSEPILAMDVRDWDGEQKLSFDTASIDSLLTFPKDFQHVDLAEYRAQAIMRLNKIDPQMGAGSPNGEGNAYSEVQLLSEAQNEERVVNLCVDRIIPDVKVVTSQFRQSFSVYSTQLSKFYGRAVTLHASINLPASYHSNPLKRYPVLFDIPSYGGSHHFPRPIKTANDRGIEFIQVDLDATCPLGHHAYADSDNNGPFGSALIKEFLPALDAKYRTVSDPSARFLTGVSSGGWSSLWLQVTFPMHFNGVWSCSPDPVDFSDFQGINLYDPSENMYRDKRGMRRPITVTKSMWFDELSQLESVLGDGGQLHSFEAVFSGRDSDGTPCLLWNRDTGAIDPKVVQQWQRFDIRKKIECDWNVLQGLLRGKIHVDVDSQDSFFLERSVINLKQVLADLGSDAVVTLHSGVGHGAYLNDTFYRQMANEMADRFLDETNSKP